MHETYWVHSAARVMETLGTGIIVAGSIMALVLFVVRVMRRTHALDGEVASLRSNLGSAILLGLEFLVAGDIINTVAIEPSLQSLAVLGGIVLIRTFLSFSLEVEIEGRWPWQKGKASRQASDGTGEA